MSFSYVQYGLVHIAAGDLLRAEVNSGSKNGKLAKDYMEKGLLVPNEIVALVGKSILLFSYVVIFVCNVPVSIL